jgi:hypothetical protein
VLSTRARSTRDDDRDQLLDLQTTDSFRLYLDEVARHPLLTKEDEIELSQAYEAGLDAQLKLADCTDDDPARPELEAIADHGEWARHKTDRLRRCRAHGVDRGAYPAAAVRALDWNVLFILAGSVGLGAIVVRSGLADVL